MSEAFILKVLAVFGSLDSHDDLWWRCDGAYAPVTFFVNCNDLFWWGCADLEEVTPENLPVLEQCIVDCGSVRNLDCRIYATSLFCARVRKLRPQGCCYPENRDLWPLFDAAGPERVVDGGNPYPPGGKMKTPSKPSTDAKET